MKMKRIRDLREDNDYTQADIAKILSITQPQYTLYELGDRSFPLEKLKTLAEHYNVSIDYLMERTDYKRVVQAEEMSPRNERMISYFTSLTPEEQDIIMGKMAEFRLSKRNKPKKVSGN